MKKLRQLKEELKIPAIGQTFSRNLMPQISPDFINYLKKQGISHEIKDVDTKNLKSTQMEFDPTKIHALMNRDDDDSHIYVSNDDHVIDGHHRWLADHNTTGKTKACVVDLPALELYRHAREYESLLKEEVTHKQFGPLLDSFVSFAADKLGIQSLPKISYKNKDDHGDQPSFGGYNPQSNEIILSTKDRHPMDVLRTLAHELVHHKQNEDGRIKDVSKEGSTGSPIEDEANSVAGRIMRWFGKAFPDTFKMSYIIEEEQTFKTMFKGSSLEPHYQTVRAATQKHNVPFNIAAGIMAHETGYGKNVRYNNPAGLMDPKNNMKTKMKFDTPESGIDAAVRTIGRNYERGGRTIEGMAKRYAPVGAANDPGGLNKYWPSSVKKISDRFSSSTSSEPTKPTQPTSPNDSIDTPGFAGGAAKSASAPEPTPAPTTEPTPPVQQKRSTSGAFARAARSTDNQTQMQEDLRKWFREKWVRFDTKGKIKGQCAREEGEGKPKCLPLAKARSIGQEARKKAAQRKRREDPVADRKGKGEKPVFVKTEEYLMEKNVPTNPTLWSKAKSLARQKFDVYPSAYANGWAAKWYKSKGGGWKSKSVDEELSHEHDWGTTSLTNILKRETPGQSEKDIPADLMYPRTFPMRPLFEGKKKFVRKKKLEEDGMLGSTLDMYLTPYTLPSQDSIGPEYGNRYSGISGFGAGIQSSAGTGYSYPFGTLAESEPHSVNDEIFDEKNPVHQWVNARLTKPTGPHNRITPHQAHSNFKEFMERHSKDPDFGGKDVGIHQFVSELKKYAGIETKKGNDGSLFFNAGLHMPPKSLKDLKEAWEAIGKRDMGTVEKGTDEGRFDEGSIIDFSQKKDEKKMGEFAKELAGKVKERMKAQSELVQKYKDAGKFDFDVGDRFSTPFTRERNEPPYNIVGHFVDEPRKGTGPTKHGYYVQRKYGEGKEDVEKHKIYIHDGKTNWGEGFKKIEPLKSIKEDWQKVNRQDKTDGLSQKAVNAYRREHPGSKLKTAVTEKNPTGKRAKRRLSFCRRMKGMKNKLTSAKTSRDPDSRINKALRRWNCEE